MKVLHFFTFLVSGFSRPASPTSHAAGTPLTRIAPLAQARRSHVTRTPLMHPTRFPRAGETPGLSHRSGFVQVVDVVTTTTDLISTITAGSQVRRSHASRPPPGASLSHTHSPWRLLSLSITRSMGLDFGYFRAFVFSFYGFTIRPYNVKQKRK